MKRKDNGIKIQASKKQKKKRKGSTKGTEAKNVRGVGGGKGRPMLNLIKKKKKG